MIFLCFLPDINDDAISFLTSTDFLEFHKPGTLDLGQEEVVLSFRTFHQKGLLLYLYDHVNNFLQLEVRGQGVLGIVYNNGRKIVSQDINARGMDILFLAFLSFFDVFD